MNIKLRTWIACTLCAFLGFTSSISLGEAPPAFTSPDAAAADIIGVQRGTSLRICSFTPMNGVFATDMWGNNTADMDVRALLHGYETVTSTRLAGLEVNPTVVADVTAWELEDGSRQYEIELAQDLFYNDGTPVTAQDYAFALLLGGAPEAQEIGAAPQGLRHLVGYDAYSSGTTDVLSGVRLLSDTRFALRIRADYLPYFYGLAMLSIRPLPISVIAPGCKVFDDGDGAYIGATESAGIETAEALGYIPGVFSAQMLLETLLNEETGYVFNPRRTCGPYQLESYDAELGEACFLINGQYKGNYEGKTPHIERLVFRYVPEDRMLAELSAGNVDVLNKVMDAAVVRDARQMQSEGASIRFENYLRTGFAFLAFACETEPTSSVSVRRAVAMGFDKDALVDEALAGVALRSYGYYGLGQWMATYVFEDPEALPVRDTLAELDVPMDVEAAAALLASDGWTLNESGGPFQSGVDTVRYREKDGTLEPLAIRLAVTASGDPVTDCLKTALAESLPELGIRLEISELPFPELLSRYYRQTDRQYDMFFLASNFSYIYDPYYDFNTLDAYQGMVNTSGLKDDVLMELARDMRQTNPADFDSYMMKWLTFQRRFVEVMPLVPLYSNVYTDVYTSNLKNYDVQSNMGWAFAITYAYIEEAQE